MKIEEARKLFDKDKFEEIAYSEWNNMCSDGEISVCVDEGHLYFKPKQQYPAMLDDHSYKITVHNDGTIEIFDKDNCDSKYFNGSLKLLYNAVEISKKARKQNEN